MWLANDPRPRSKDMSFFSTIWAGLSSPRASRTSDSSATCLDPGRSDLNGAGWACLARRETRGCRKVLKALSFHAKDRGGDGKQTSHQRILYRWLRADNVDK